MSSIGGFVGFNIELRRSWILRARLEYILLLSADRCLITLIYIMFLVENDVLAVALIVKCILLWVLEGVIAVRLYCNPIGQHIFAQNK